MSNLLFLLALLISSFLLFLALRSFFLAINTRQHKNDDLGGNENFTFLPQKFCPPPFPDVFLLILCPPLSGVVGPSLSAVNLVPPPAPARAYLLLAPPLFFPSLSRFKKFCPSWLLLHLPLGPPPPFLSQTFSFPAPSPLRKKKKSRGLGGAFAK